MRPTTGRRTLTPHAKSGLNKPHLRLHAEGIDTESLSADLLAKIENRSAVIGVIGLGYVGLPFAVEKAKAGFRVVGIDQNLDRVKKVNCAENYISDVVDEELSELVKGGKLEASNDFDMVAELDIIVIAVPTPLTANLTPDLTFVSEVSAALARRLRPGQLISLESTTYPGTTRDVMQPLLEESGFLAERDFFLAHSPERVDPGNRKFNTKNTTKVVGAIGPFSHKVAVAFYGVAIDNVVSVSNAETAEMVKVFENTFRAVNIALVNEMALLCDRMKMNVWEVLDAAFTKPFGIMPFYPGPGVGGHCIPLDPHYLEWKAKEFQFNTRFINLAGDVNRKMPNFVREKATRLLNQAGVAPSCATILMLGVSYKRDLGDYRESPALEVIRLFEEDGAEVMYHDPYVPFFEEHEISRESVTLKPELLQNCDLVVITSDHTNIDYSWVVEHSRQVLDTRNATRNVTSGREKITLL